MHACSTCSETFDNHSLLANHIRWKHKRAQQESKCRFCSETFNNANLSPHENRCNVWHLCDHCGTKTRNERFCSKTCSAITNNRDKKTGYAVYRKNNGIINKEADYRRICFEHFSKKCALCEWNVVVDVHHVDRDRKNNEPQNLIPLCQNHHKLTQLKRFRKDLDNQIAEIIKKTFGTVSG